jgi:hypothetical protein
VRLLLFLLQRFHLPDTLINPVYKFCRISPLVLLLCSCTLAASKNNSTPIVVAPCTAGAISSVKKTIPPLTRFKQPLPKNLYYSDNERVRKLNMASMHNESIYLDTNFQDETRLPAHLKNKTLDDGWHSKPKVPWSRFQFELNDRWQLGADLPDLKNFANGDGHLDLVPIPRLSYDFGSVKLTSLYIPQIQDYNLTSVMGLYLIITF